MTSEWVYDGPLLDKVPSGYEPALGAERLSRLGVEVVKVRGGAGFCVPVWARRLEGFRIYRAKPEEQPLVDAAIHRLAQADEQSIAAAMTVFDLGGIDSLVEFVREVEQQ